MDEIGRRYLLLALRLGRHLPDLISSCLGPADLAEAVAGEALTPAEELHLEALALQAEVAERVGGSEADDRRRAWLVDQLGALAASARLVGGEEIGFVDLVEELFGIAAEAEPQATFDSARHHLAELLPPGKDLAARLREHERSASLPAEVALRAIRRISNALRTRTIRDVWLPEGESVEFVGRPGGDSTTYLGGLQSRISVDTRRPLTIERLLHLAGHDAYPGHHAERAAKEALLIRERGLGEAMVRCRFTPAEAISDGLAELGRGLVLDDQELGGVLRHLLRDLGLSIPDAAVDRELLVARARGQLGRASANAALMAWHEGVPMAEVRSWLAETALIGEDQLDVEMRQLATPRTSTGSLGCLAGPRVVAEWLEGKGPTHGLSRLLGEQLTPSQLRAEMTELSPLH